MKITIEIKPLRNIAIKNISVLLLLPDQYSKLQIHKFMVEVVEVLCGLRFYYSIRFVKNCRQHKKPMQNSLVITFSPTQLILSSCPPPWSAEVVIGQFQNINFYANSVFRAGIANKVAKANVSIYLASDETRVAEKEDNLK